MKNGTNLFFHRKPSIILKCISENPDISQAEISRKIETNYAHTTRIIKKFDLLGLLNVSTVGREIRVSLSGEGQKVISVIENAENTIGGLDENIK